jgi:hypothetical protein
MTDVGETDRALDSVAVAVAANLAASGWRRRRLGIWWLDTFTRELAGGVLGTVEVQRLVAAFGEEWPTDVRVYLGVGYEPALGLMPLVALAPVATLVNDDAASRVVTLHDEGEVAQSAREIAAFVDEHAATVAARFPDADRVAEALRGAADVIDEEWQQRRRERYLTMLTAMGRLEEAAVLLGSYRERYSVGGDGERARRFARQLSRRLAGMPSPIPPVEDTLAMLPASPLAARQQPPNDAAVDDRAQRAAFEAIHAQARGKSLAELRQLIVDEFERRGLTVPPSSAATMAEIVATERKPFGGVRVLAGGLWMAGSLFCGLWRTVKEGIQAGPEWTRPPERAAYPVPPSSNRYITVIIDPGTRDWLARIRAHRPRAGLGVGSATRVDVWLTHAGPNTADQTVTAYIGDRRVGTLARLDAAPFVPFFDAAKLYDEDLVLSGRLSHTADDVDILEIPQPDPARIDDDATADYFQTPEW